MKIENRGQLELLHLRFAQVDGALAVSKNAQAVAETYVRQYMETLSMILGVPIEHGASVNWETGEVTLAEGAEVPQNGVAV